MNHWKRKKEDELKKIDQQKRKAYVKRLLSSKYSKVEKLTYKKMDREKGSTVLVEIIIDN